MHKTQTTDALKAILLNINSALRVGKGIEDCSGIIEPEVTHKFLPNKNNQTQRSKYHFTQPKLKKRNTQFNKAQLKRN